MLSKAFEGSVDYLQVLDENGQLDPSLMPADLNDAKLLDMLKWMLFARAADAKALSLQRQGIAVTYAPLVGQEATQIGAALAMRRQDIFVPNFRQHGVLLARGLPLYNFYLSTRGFEDANKVSEPDQRDLLLRSRGEPDAARRGHRLRAEVSRQGCRGSGIRRGRRHVRRRLLRGAQLRGRMEGPACGVIENNQWAISVPRKSRRPRRRSRRRASPPGSGASRWTATTSSRSTRRSKDAIAASKDGPDGHRVRHLQDEHAHHRGRPDQVQERRGGRGVGEEGPDREAEEAPHLRRGCGPTEAETKLAEDNLKKIDEAVEQAVQFKPDPKSMFENVYSFMPEI